MRAGARISVIIPALNEERSVGMVVRDIPDWVDEVIVVCTGSTDATAGIARAHGARVAAGERMGYGAACMDGVALVRSDDGLPPDIVAFLDGDGSDPPDDLAAVVDPIIHGECEMVFGSRRLGAARGKVEFASQSSVQRLANWIARMIIRVTWRARYTDIGRFRAIRHPKLMTLNLQETGVAWPLEMQIRAAERELYWLEAPVGHRRRRNGASRLFATPSAARASAAEIVGLAWRRARAVFEERRARRRARRPRRPVL